MGGLLVDYAGISLPSLFQISAIFSVVWTVIFYLIYKVFCKKHEDELIEAKKEEEQKLGNNDQKNDHDLSSNVPDEIELRQRKDVINRHLKTKSTLEFEDSMKYWNTQIAGKTKL